MPRHASGEQLSVGFQTDPLPDGYLTDLEQLGIFEAAAALAFARPYGYTDEDATVLWDVVARRTEAAGLPVLANVEVGHTDPMITVPLGVPAELDATNKQLRLLEPPTAHRG
jgi:muramoyltetrapeptide carboxypeptidase